MYGVSEKKNKVCTHTNYTHKRPSKANILSAVSICTQGYISRDTSKSTLVISFPMDRPARRDCCLLGHARKLLGGLMSTHMYA